MGPTDAEKLVRLGERHLKDAQALSMEAHWNQVAADWKMMIAAGEAIGVEDENGCLVASALTLPYGDRFGWISMVLVTASRRKQGIATRLLNSCIETLDLQGLVSVLDATPAGENVYRPLGFLPHFGFQRWQHPTVEQIDPQMSAFEKCHPQSTIELDQDVFGGDRASIIENLLARSNEFSCLDPTGTGFALGRDGNNATQVGPICAADPETAIGMLDYALARLTGPVFIDACSHQTEFVDKLKSYGFVPQRPYLRMAKGRPEPFGDPGRMFAMAGPELG